MRRILKNLISLLPTSQTSILSKPLHLLPQNNYQIMKHTLLIAFALSATILTTPSCKKDKKKGCMDIVSVRYDSEAEEDDGSCTYGGTGGNVILVAKPAHHGVPIISGTQGHPDSLFIKFNVIESPGTNPAAYDLKVGGENGHDHVEYAGLKPGKYFLYMTGYDSLGQYFVKGGIPYTITAESGEVTVNVPVVE